MRKSLFTTLMLASSMALVSTACSAQEEPPPAEPEAAAEDAAEAAGDAAENAAEDAVATVESAAEDAAEVIEETVEEVEEVVEEVVEEAPAEEAPAEDAAADEAAGEGDEASTDEAAAGGDYDLERLAGYGVSAEMVAEYAALTGDAANGERIFRQCIACHALQEGANRVGPSLYGIIGRDAGTVEGFRYSPANQNSGVTWFEPVLYTYLANPREFIPGTIMAFVGLRDPQQRADVIAYIRENGGIAE